jgi:hypothetical protein
MYQEYIIYLPYLFERDDFKRALEDPRFSPSYIIIIKYNDGGLLSTAIFCPYSQEQIGKFYQEYFNNLIKGTTLQENNPYLLFKNRFQKAFSYRYKIIVTTILAYEESHKVKIRYLIAPQRNPLL